MNYYKKQVNEKKIIEKQGIFLKLFAARPKRIVKFKDEYIIEVVQKNIHVVLPVLYLENANDQDLDIYYGFNPKRYTQDWWTIMDIEERIKMPFETLLDELILEII